MKKPKTVRAVMPNSGVEAAYHKALSSLVSEMANSVEYWLEAAYKANPPRIATDALPSAELNKRVKELSRRWLKRFDEVAVKMAERFTKQGYSHTSASFQQALKDSGFAVKFQVTPVIRDALNATIKENVSLIKSIPSQYFTQVEGTIMRGFTAGRDLHQISTDLKKHYGVTSRRAAFIARDQSNKLTATVTQARRVELGLFEAEWKHSHAGKDPRSSHVKAGKDKLRFDVRKGALIDGEYIQPGYLPGCRCGSKTILPF